MKIVRAYHALDVPAFYTPSHLAVSAAFLAILLLPVYIAAAGWFGLKVIVLLALSCVAGAITEFAGILVTGKHTGYLGFTTWFLFPLMVPPGIELWMSVLCLILAIIVTVIFFGGHGHHVFHPSVVAQVFVMINFATRFSGSFLRPRFDMLSGFSSYVSIPETGETAIGLTKTGTFIPGIQLFFGPNSGFLSDAFPFLILAAGCIFLVFGGVNRKTPVTFLASLAVFSFIGNRYFPSAIPAVPQTMLAGSAFFYAFFILSDRWTSPKSGFGRVSAGIIAALLTLLMRAFSTHMEAVMYATLFTYAFAPLLDELGFRIWSLRYKAVPAPNGSDI